MGIRVLLKPGWVRIIFFFRRTSRFFRLRY